MNHKKFTKPLRKYITEISKTTGEKLLGISMLADLV